MHWEKRDDYMLMGLCIKLEETRTFITATVQMHWLYKAVLLRTEPHFPVTEKVCLTPYVTYTIVS